jgi:hypothetical protein
VWSGQRSGRSTPGIDPLPIVQEADTLINRHANFYMKQTSSRKVQHVDVMSCDIQAV